MNAEDIKNYVQSHKLVDNKCFKITFKKRNSLSGIIINCKDAADLQSKNFWRIVTSPNIKEWNNTKDINLSRIYHGSDFTRIAVDGKD